MKRQNRVPIQSPPQAQRAKGGRLNEFMFVFSFEDAKLQPGLARQFHFGIEKQPPFGAVGRQHPPEVECIAGLQFGLAAPAPTEADTAHQFVD